MTHHLVISCVDDNEVELLILCTQIVHKKPLKNGLVAILF